MRDGGTLRATRHEADRADAGVARARAVRPAGLGSRQHFGALLLGLYEGKRLRYVGKVGTGFVASLLASLGARLGALRTDSSPFEPAPRERGVTWVRPRLVAEITYAEWTAGGRLRHPTFLGMRHDKKPTECTWAEREL
jgi:bifunctional non-homologous end joining protein LigD